jgi:hypothetical protein
MMASIPCTGNSAPLNPIGPYLKPATPTLFVYLYLRA